jgi:hypothetical protein
MGKRRFCTLVCYGACWCRRAAKAVCIWLLTDKKTSANRRIESNQKRILKASYATATSVRRI